MTSFGVDMLINKKQLFNNYFIPTVDYDSSLKFAEWSFIKKILEFFLSFHSSLFFSFYRPSKIL